MAKPTTKKKSGLSAAVVAALGASLADGTVALKVRTDRASFRRGGQEFTQEARIIAVEDLEDADVVAILGEPRLLVEQLNADQLKAATGETEQGA